MGTFQNQTVTFLDLTLIETNAGWLRVSFDSPCSVIVVDSWSDLKSGFQYFPNAKGVVVLKNHTNDIIPFQTTRTIIEIYQQPQSLMEKVSLKMHCQSQIVTNIWNREHGFLLDFIHSYGLCQDKKVQLKRMDFTVAVFGAPPSIFVSLKRPIFGIDPDILQTIANHYGFSVKFQPNREWGRFVNGSWTGVVGSVIKITFRRSTSAINHFRLPGKQPILEWDILQ